MVRASVSSCWGGHIAYTDLKFAGIRACVQARLADDPDHLASFPGLLTSSVWSLAVCKEGRRRLGDSDHVIYGTTWQGWSIGRDGAFGMVISKLWSVCVCCMCVSVCVCQCECACSLVPRLIPLPGFKNHSNKNRSALDYLAVDMIFNGILLFSSIFLGQQTTDILRCSWKGNHYEITHQYSVLCLFNKCKELW